MKITIAHAFDVDAEVYFEEAFLGAEFNQALYTQKLRFEELEISEEHRDGQLHRSLKARPPLVMPAVVKRAIGDRVSYREEGRFDPEARRFYFEIIPSQVAERISIQGELRAESRGSGRCERIAEIDIEVRIFGVGKSIEKFIAATLRENYDKGAEFTRAHLAR